MILPQKESTLASFVVIEKKDFEEVKTLLQEQESTKSENEEKEADEDTVWKMLEKLLSQGFDCEDFFPALIDHLVHLEGENHEKVSLGEGAPSESSENLKFIDSHG